MSVGVPARTRMWLGGLASAGIVVAHQVGYMVATPDPDARHEFLMRTGHGGWRFVVAAAFGLAIAGVAGFALDRTRRGPSLGVRSGRHLFWFAAARLFLLQIAGYLVMEGIERVVVDHPWAGMLGEEPVVVGLALQGLIAVVGALLLVAFGEVIELIGVLLTRRPENVTAEPDLTWDSGVASPRPRVATGSGSLRGPPVPSA